MDSISSTTPSKRSTLSPLRSLSPSAAPPQPSALLSSPAPPPSPTSSSSPAPATPSSLPSPSSSSSPSGPPSPHAASRATTPTPSRLVKHWPWRPNVYARLKTQGHILPVKLAEVTSTPPPDCPTDLRGEDGNASPFWACVYIDELDYCWWALTVAIILLDEILRLPEHEDILAPDTAEIKSLVDDLRALRDGITSDENYGGSRLWFPLESGETLDEAILVPHICWPEGNGLRDGLRLALHYSRNPGYFDNDLQALILHACNLCYALQESTGLLYFGDLPQEPLARLGAWLSAGMRSFEKELKDLKFFENILKLVMVQQGINLYGSPTLDQALSSVPAPDIIGKGAYGQVFKIPHPYWGDLAVKAPLPSQVTEQNKLVESLTNFGIPGHPNILPVVAWTLHESQIIVAMQWAENGSIDKFLVKNPDSPRALLLVSIATALRQLHEDKWIHGDLHMGNIVISNDGDAFLCDFGLAKQVADKKPQNDADYGTVEGGVPIYTAPELYEPGARRSFASEVFAFGMIIFQAYSGTRPFVRMANDEVAHHDAAIIKAVVNGARPTRDQVTRADFFDEMWNLVQDCWKQDPAHRPSMAQVVERMISMLILLPIEDVEKYLMRVDPIELTLFKPGDVALDDAMQSHERSAELRWSLSRMEHFGLKKFFTHHIDARDRIVAERARGMLHGRAPLVDRNDCDPEVLIRLYETVTGDSFAQLAPLLKNGSPYDILNYHRSSSASAEVLSRGATFPYHIVSYP